MAGLWAWFSGLPRVARIVAWILLFPLVAPLAITRGQREPVGRLVAGITVFVITAPFWMAAYTSSAGPSNRESTSTAQVEAVGEEIQNEPASADGVAEPAASEQETDGNLAGQSGGGTDSSSTTSQLEQAPASPETGSSQARAPPAAEAADGVLVSALLAELIVAPEDPTGYDRSLFRHWITTNGCTTRNRVLIDESNGTAVIGSNCTVTSGRWFSQFDAVWVEVPSAIDIDHFVPLAEAWRSGARNWDEPTRRAFANDLSDPRTLIAVTASSNRSKSDRDPANWLPTNTAYRCDYVGTWVAIKHRWELTIDSREQAAIQRVLNGCGELRTSTTVAARPATAPPPAPAPAPTPAPAPAPAPVPAPVPVPAPEPPPSGGLPIVVFANCGELNAVYPGGVAKVGVTGDMVSGELRPFGKMPIFDDALYEANIRRDGDKDGIACEKR